MSIEIFNIFVVRQFLNAHAQKIIAKETEKKQEMHPVAVLMLVLALA